MRRYRVAAPAVYGPVFQGEGALIGEPTLFVRFAGCDYRCSWCDTLYAVDPKLYKHEWAWLTVEELAAAVRVLTPDGWVTLSGGNPALQDLEPLIAELETTHRLALETQGTAAPEWLGRLEQLTLSPKPPSAGRVTPTSQVERALSRAPASVCVKVVVFTEDDLDYACTVFGVCGPAVVKVAQVGTQQGAGVEDALRRQAWLEERVRARRVACRVLPQLHALVHGARRDG